MGADKMPYGNSLSLYGLALPPAALSPHRAAPCLIRAHGSLPPLFLGPWLSPGTVLLALGGQDAGGELFLSSRRTPRRGRSYDSLVYCRCLCLI